MIIFLYGPDAYRRQENKQNIIKEYRKKYSSGMNIFDFDLSDVNNLDKLLDTVLSSSFFNEHRLVTLSNSFSKKTVADELSKLIGAHNITSAPDITFLFTESSSEKDLIAKSDILFKLITDRKNIVKIFKPLAGAELAQWIKEGFKLRNCSINLNGLNRLIGAVGNDSWALTNEIEKLTAYASEREIGVTDIDLLVSQSQELNIFDLIDAIGSQNQKEAFELLYCELKTGRDPYYILTMIIYQFRNLLAVKDLKDRGLHETEISKKSQLHPFVVKKTLKSPFQFDELVKIYSRLISIDSGFKMGSLNLEDSLYGLTLGGLPPQIKNAD